MVSEFNKYGGVEDVELLPEGWIKENLLQQAELIRALLGLRQVVIPVVDSEAPELLSPPSYASDFHFIRNWNLNAVVTVASGKPVIGLFSGASVLLRFLYLALLGDPSMLRGMEDVWRLRECASSASQRTVPSGGALRDEHLLRANWRLLARPIDSKSIERLTLWLMADGIAEPRRDLAQSLWMQATAFLMFHEVGHIVMGHFDYMKTRRGTISLAEFGEKWPGIRSSDPFVKHAFELEADRFAIAKMFEGFFARDKEQKVRLSAPGFIAMTQMSQQSRYRLWFTTMGVLFLLLEAHRQRASSPGASLMQLFTLPSHPTPAFRLKHLREFTWQRFIGNDARAKSDFESAFPDALADLRVVAQRLALWKPFAGMARSNGWYEQRMSRARAQIADEMLAFMNSVEQRYQFRSPN